MRTMNAHKHVAVLRWAHAMKPQDSRISRVFLASVGQCLHIKLEESNKIGRFCLKNLPSRQNLCQLDAHF